MSPILQLILNHVLTFAEQQMLNIAPAIIEKIEQEIEELIESVKERINSTNDEEGE